MQRPSVLFINRVYPPLRGSSGRILRDLARAMAREGWHVTVLTTGAEDGKDRDNGVRVIRVKAPAKPKGILGYYQVWQKLFKEARHMGPVHLMVTMTDPPLLAVLGERIAKTLKAKHIHWCQDLYPDLLPVLGVRLPRFVFRKLDFIVMRAMKSCDKVVVVGRCMAKQLTKKGISPGQITVIPNWPDIELAAPVDRDDFNDLSQVEEVSRPHHKNVNGYRPPEQQLKDMPKFRVLYAGNLGRAHPVETILEAAGVLRDENPEIEFVFVGDGPGFDHVAELRNKRHLTNVRLLPYQPASRLRTIMESGDIHLISMKEEAAGLVVPSKLYSALAVGRPTIFIGPVQSETAKVLHDFQAGSVLPQGDGLALVEEIRRYRFNSEDWFAAHNAAVEAGRVFVPRESIEAWIERAWALIETNVRVAQRQAAE